MKVFSVILVLVGQALLVLAMYLDCGTAGALFLGGLMAMADGSWVLAFGNPCQEDEKEGKP